MKIKFHIRILSLVFSVLFGISSGDIFSLAQSKFPVYTDISGHFAQSAIQYVTRSCNVTGYPITSTRSLFKPDNPINRAEWVQMIISCEGSTVPPITESPFIDVPNNEWYSAALSYAKSKDWIDGYADGRYRPARDINRAEAITVALKSKYVLQQIGDIPTFFKDVPKDIWYRKFASFAAMKGYVFGYKTIEGVFTGNFGGASPLTRGEAAVILQKIFTPIPYTFSEGFSEAPDSSDVRSLFTEVEFNNFLPIRGKFRFPVPYKTEAARLTNTDLDCGSNDCLYPVGYSYWRNINNHASSNIMYIFLTLSRQRSGTGPTLFSYNKSTGEVTNLGSIFKDDFYLNATGEGWYFSATAPTILYINRNGKMERYDIISKQFEMVFNSEQEFPETVIWQMHSSDDDRVHSATLKNKSDNAILGCMTYREDTKEYNLYKRIGEFDECQVDKSGEWLIIKENVDGKNGEENRIININTGEERVLYDEQGAAGHSDLGYGYLVGADGYDTHPNAIKVWKFSQDPLEGSLVYYNGSWNVNAPNHISHTNAKDGAPENQFACGSGSNKINGNRANEIMCFKLDGSNKVTVIAPTMTDFTQFNRTEYDLQPKGNLDVTGQYFIWTANPGGDRLDAFLVKVPAIQ